MPTNLKNYKEEKHASLIRAHSLAKSTRAIIISYISDKESRDFINEATHAIDVVILDDTPEAREGADAFITDDWSLAPTAPLMSGAVVPIGPRTGADTVGLTEFNPMKFEGNSFLFDTLNKFQIFAALVRYLENVKYPGDKRTLLKNVTGEK